MSREHFTPQVSAGRYIRTAPELVAEVVSPGDNAADLNVKVADYLAAGVRLVWLMYPATREVWVFRVDGSSQRLRAEDILDGGDVWPGFTILVSTLFD